MIGDQLQRMLHEQRRRGCVEYCKLYQPPLCLHHTVAGVRFCSAVRSAWISVLCTFAVSPTSPAAMDTVYMLANEAMISQRVGTYVPRAELHHLVAQFSAADIREHSHLIAFIAQLIPIPGVMCTWWRALPDLLIGRWMHTAVGVNTELVTCVDRHWPLQYREILLRSVVEGRDSAHTWAALPGPLDPAFSDELATHLTGKADLTCDARVWGALLPRFESVSDELMYQFASRGWSMVFFLYAQHYKTASFIQNRDWRVYLRAVANDHVDVVAWLETWLGSLFARGCVNFRVTEAIHARALQVAVQHDAYDVIQYLQKQPVRLEMAEQARAAMEVCQNPKTLALLRHF